MPQIDKRITFDIDLATSDTEMLPAGTSSDSCELRSPEPIYGSIDNEMSTDIDQEEASWPLANNHHLAQDLPHPEGQAHIRNLKNPPKHSKVAVDMTSDDFQHTRLADPVHAFVPASTPNLAPCKRIAGLDLHPLNTANASIEPSEDHDNRRTTLLNQRRRPNQRTLMPKSSSPRDLQIPPSPQSSKSTPDSARTDLSFASTVTSVTLPGSAITTPSSAEIRSPANASSPGENYLTCRDCGKTFQTPGQQKCVFPFTKVCSSPTMKSNPASSNILTRASKETLQSSTQPPLRMRYLHATLWRESRP